MPPSPPTPGPPPSRFALKARVALSGLATSAAWVLALGITLLVCIYGAWLAATYGVDAILDSAAKPISNAEAAAAAGAAQVAVLVQSLAGQARSALEDAPPEVANTEWWVLPVVCRAVRGPLVYMKGQEGEGGRERHVIPGWVSARAAGMHRVGVFLTCLAF